MVALAYLVVQGLKVSLEMKDQRVLKAQMVTLVNLVKWVLRDQEESQGTWGCWDQKALRVLAAKLDVEANLEGLG